MLKHVTPAPNKLRKGPISYIQKLGLVISDVLISPICVCKTYTGAGHFRLQEHIMNKTAVRRTAISPAAESHNMEVYLDLG